jgi:hypothetical protein
MKAAGGTYNQRQKGNSDRGTPPCFVQRVRFLLISGKLRVSFKKLSAQVCENKGAHFCTLEKSAQPAVENGLIPEAKESEKLEVRDLEREIGTRTTLVRISNRSGADISNDITTVIVSQ